MSFVEHIKSPLGRFWRLWWWWWVPKSWVSVTIWNKNKIYSGHSADTDVVVAAANAFVNALNRLVFSEKKNSIHPQFDNLENTEKEVFSNPKN